MEWVVAPAGAPNQAAMLRQIQKMQEDMEAAQAALEDETIDVSVGGGAVTIVITGSQVSQVDHDQSGGGIPDDEEWLTDLQDLLLAVMNQAIEQSQGLCRGADAGRHRRPGFDAARWVGRSVGLGEPSSTQSSTHDESERTLSKAIPQPVTQSDRGVFTPTGRGAKNGLAPDLFLIARAG